MHGLFPPQGVGGFYLNLEKANREKLLQLANALNVRIAVPVAKVIRRGFRDWRAGSGVRSTFREIEAQSVAVCGAALAKPRALIGFSQGGYFTRDLAFTCRNITGIDYAVLIMSGAKPAVPAERLLNCNNMVVASGEDDSSTDVGGTKFENMALKMKARYPNIDIRIYPGRHVLPPNDLLAEYLRAIP